MTAAKTRGLLILPEYQWWYNAIQKGDVFTIKDALTRLSKNRRINLSMANLLIQNKTNVKLQPGKNLTIACLR